MQTILIAGGCGFVGSNLSLLLKEKYPSYRIIALDNLRRKGSELNVARLQEQGIEFIKADIRNREQLQLKGPIHTVIDAAAEPSVIAGIHSDSEYLVETNFNGTVNLLDLAHEHKSFFLFLSTSRIYPIAALEEIPLEERPTRFSIHDDFSVRGCSAMGISEEFTLDGVRSLYGTTKLAAEMMIREYQVFYGLRAVINRCGVIAGPYQMGKVDQGFMTWWMARHFWKRNISYYGYGGKGKQVRDVLHIDDLFDLIDQQVHDPDLFAGKLFNVGGGNENSVSLAELTEICRQITGNKIVEEGIPENRVADIPLYITDNSRIKVLAGWNPKLSVQRTAEDIFSWMRQNENQLKPILDG